MSWGSYSNYIKPVLLLLVNEILLKLNQLLVSRFALIWESMELKPLYL